MTTQLRICGVKVWFERQAVCQDSRHPYTFLLSVSDAEFIHLLILSSFSR